MPITDFASTKMIIYMPGMIFKFSCEVITKTHFKIKHITSLFGDNNDNNIIYVQEWYQSYTYTIQKKCKYFKISMQFGVIWYW